MKQEPVASIMIYGKDDYVFDYFGDMESGIHPLYTAPQTKPLSDEELDNIIQKLNQSKVTWSGNQFIKEAIRQAEEKHGIK